MFTAQFWKEVAERAIKTFFQTLVATGIIASAVGATTQQWKDAGLAVGIATLLSVLTSIAGVAVGPKGSASLVEPVTDVPAAPLEEVIVIPEDLPEENNLEDRQAITDYLAGGK